MIPFSQTSSQTAGHLGEQRLIAAIRDWLGPASPPPPGGIGDDCAVIDLAPGTRALMTTDPILWKRHFDETVSPEQAAAKLLKRNLSDIAAMGGRPRAAVVSLLLPLTTSLEWLERFHRGLRESALEFAVSIAGGDISQTDGLLAACMTLLGETTGGRALTRAGAQIGDRLLVTGSLGGSIRGHHLSFRPRLAEGQWLAARPEVKAAMDVSDGLAKDLLAILPAGSSAWLDTGKIPVSRDAGALSAETGKPSLLHALEDGEDYELLVAVDGQADLATFRAAWHQDFHLLLTEVGSVRKLPPGGAALCGLPDSVTERLSGYEHLR